MKRTLLMFAAAIAVAGSAPAAGATDDFSWRGATNGVKRPRKSK